jgi:hypothetical protein
MTRAGRGTAPAALFCRSGGRSAMTHGGKDGFTRKFCCGNLLRHAHLFDQAERRLNGAKRLIQHLPVPSPVPQTAQRISEVDVHPRGVERCLICWPRLKRGAVGRGGLF